MIIENQKEHIDSLFHHCKVHKIFGTAGAGKTTELISRLNELFEQDVEPNRIAFVSFTNKAVDEIISRCINKFTQFKKEQFIHFRTIHSMCYRTLKQDNKQIIDYKELITLASTLGLKVSSFLAIEDGAGKEQGDKVINIESLSRLKMIPLEEQWKQSNEQDCPFYILEKWQKKLEKYKKENQLLDFTDMLELYNSVLNVDYIFIDEAQDLCPLQWEVMHKASKNCKTVFIAGDDDQSIFNWAGALVDYFLDMKADEETILKESHRLPNVVYTLSRKILSKVKKRKIKECEPIIKSGSIKKVNNLYNVKFDINEKYLILVRNRWQLREVEEHLKLKGFVYSLFEKNVLDCNEFEAIKIWIRIQNKEIIEKREFRKIQKLSSILLQYNNLEQLPKNILEIEWYDIFNLLKKDSLRYFQRVFDIYQKKEIIPNIKISTIHQAKGGEEDNVVLFTDVSFTVWKNINTDNEHKVWYVAITRTKKNLFIVSEQSTLYYHIPL
jgi:superfamily I DNA/RNA helicase